MIPLPTAAGTATTLQLIGRAGLGHVGVLVDTRVETSDRLGPSPDDLFERYGSWDKALEAISRTSSTMNRMTGVAP